MKESGDSKEQRTHRCLQNNKPVRFGELQFWCLCSGFFPSKEPAGPGLNKMPIEGQSSALEIIYSAHEVTSPLLGAQDGSGGNNGGCE